MTIIRNRAERRAAEKHLAKTNATYSEHLVKLPESEWPADVPWGLAQVWRNRDYLVQVFEAQNPCRARLSILRTAIDRTGWKADIPWEDLQRLKNECGYEGWDAVEVYPSQKDVVNVANIRHLWIMVEPLSFAWRRT